MTLSGLETSVNAAEAYVNDHLLARLSHDQTRLTPREVVHAPEGVERKVERERGNGQDVEDHPTDHVPLATKQEHEGLQTVDGDNHDDRRGRDTLVLSRNQVDEIDDLDLG